MIADAASLGLYGGYVVAAIAVIVFVVGVVVALAASGTPRQKRSDRQMGGGICLVAAVLAVVTLVALWPLKHDYHHWVTKSGEVSSIGHRQIKDGDSFSERYVLTLNGQPFGVDDTRAAAVKVGDFVTLGCKKEHQFLQKYRNDGWACRWGN